MPELCKLKMHLGSRRAVSLYLATLDANTMESLLLQLEAEFFWRKRSRSASGYSRKVEAQLSRIYRNVKKRIANGRVPPERTSSGAVIERRFSPIDGPLRYENIMLDEDFYCWQMDNYSANWSNAKSLTLVSYTEGDICQIQCENDDQYRAEVSRLVKFVIEQAA